MYKVTISPNQVQETLSKHILADGYDMVFDMEKSNGVWIHDVKNDRKLLDFFTCFASLTEVFPVVGYPVIDFSTCPGICSG